MTMMASNMLKPSLRKSPPDANVLRRISVKKMVKKPKSMSSSVCGLISKNWDKVKSNKMKNV